MLFRRISKHVKEQNWTAIFIDFFIVVVGVFVGMQVSNWNASKANQDEYQRAIGRFEAELRINIKNLQQIETELKGYIGSASAGFEALRTCSDSPENLQLINKGMDAISGTTGVSILSSAMRDITESQGLLSQQTELERQRFANTRYKLELFLIEIKYAEDLPFNNQVQDSLSAGIGELKTKIVEISSNRSTRVKRELILSVPVNEACKDDQLIKAFYTWENQQTKTPGLSMMMRQEMEMTLDYLKTL